MALSDVSNYQIQYQHSLTQLVGIAATAQSGTQDALLFEFTAKP